MSDVSPPQRFVPSVKAPADHEGPSWKFAFRRRALLVTDDYRLPSTNALDAAELRPRRIQYLGRWEDTPCYALELDPEVEAPEGMTFRDLRRLYGALPEAQYIVAGRAVQVVEWDRTHQFCGACGHATETADEERFRRCPKCKLNFFPRLAPAMIVAVEREDEILLARSPHFPPEIYSVPAGFVEPGESAEDAVIREIWEETHIVCRDVRYFGSQPWPFPHSLMLGFTARYASGEIAVDGKEVVDAGWFKASAMPKTFSGNISISQWLIRDFLSRHGSKGAD